MGIGYRVGEEFGFWSSLFTSNCKQLEIPIDVFLLLPVI